MSTEHEDDSKGVSALVKRMGSKRGFDPIPPDQYDWQKADGVPPIHRVWSWMCAHTIRIGHRTEFAVAAQTKAALSLKHIQDDLGMDLAQVSRVWAEGEAKGLWKRKGKLLYLNGEVTAEQIAEANKKRKLDCTVNLSPSELLKLKKLPKERQDEFYSFWLPAQEFRRKVAADAIAVARETSDELEDTILGRYGIERKRLDKEARKPIAVPQLLFEFVQSTAFGVTVQPLTVYRTDGEERGENVAVPSTHIRSQRKPSEKRAAAANSGQAEADELAGMIATDAAAAFILLMEARKHTESATVAELAELWNSEAQRILPQVRSGRVSSPTGLLLRTVPALATGERLATVRLTLALRANQDANEAREREEGRAAMLREYHDAKTPETERAFIADLLGMVHSSAKAATR